ncbi:hypothetical protein RhiirA5_427022 [Rhizophagus irregularis]|uniref:Uncharacterized protein n=1 Tax=Rhizophagus irregularis TaxID=588596 RepID=A0A2N0P377_9GLOM|nr:hypothetical protein RhiirA5_427022 [Rhizophagus irregularis]GET59277.1 hypothetical protein RIR_jg753.t1 [Rhizophagus irregularis DAOM 181602=DAOM 197198]
MGKKDLGDKNRFVEYYYLNIYASNCIEGMENRSCLSSIPICATLHFHIIHYHILLRAKYRIFFMMG